MGETSSLADYILPTRHFLEDYATEHVAPTILTQTSAVRVPVVEPVHKDSKLLEEICIDLGVKMGLPGFGKDGFGPGDPLLAPWDWYKKLVANIAYGDKENDAVPGAPRRRSSSSPGPGRPLRGLRQGLQRGPYQPCLQEDLSDL
jgi:anaerobic selenocysteine-containing dehydrogenase